MSHAPALAHAAQLPAQWAAEPNRAHFTVLCSHFGQGQAFQATLQAWRSCPQRPQRLVFVSRAQHWPEPPNAAADPWPPATRNLHLQDYEGGRVRLLLALGPDTHLPWRQLRQVQADALWLAGTDFVDTTRDARHAALAIKTIARLAAPRARLALWQATPEQVAALQAAGCSFDGAGHDACDIALDSASISASGHAHDSATAGTASSAPDTARIACFMPNFKRSTAAPARAPDHAVIVGAGIAGACAAAALAMRGWRCTVLDARALPAGGASGNPAAIFHGTVHAADGLHARFTRAAALHAQRVHAGLLAQGVPGQMQGLLRAGASASAPLPPAGWASLRSAPQLHAAHSHVLAGSAWFFPGGGWIEAAAAVRALLASPGVEFRGHAAVARLQRDGDQWLALDSGGRPLADSGVVVLAGAGAGDSQGQATQAMADLLHGAGAQAWPGQRARGQVTWFHHDAPALPLPVAGGGYALQRPATAELLCGATTQADDDDPHIREADHAFNLARLQDLTGLGPAAGTPLHGRVAWRERVADRLPVVGAAVDAQALRGLPVAEPGTARGRALRLPNLPRLPGLFVLGAMAGRGFTWGPLAGEVLASCVDQTPQPLEADLLDALDPARFWLRQVRRAPTA